MILWELKKGGKYISKDPYCKSSQKVKTQNGFAPWLDQNLKVKYEYNQAWNSSDRDFAVIAIFLHWPLPNIILSSSSFSALGCDGEEREEGEMWGRAGTGLLLSLTAQGSHSRDCSSLRANTSTRAVLRVTCSQHTHLVTHKPHCCARLHTRCAFHSLTQCTVDFKHHINCTLPGWKLSVNAVENELALYHFRGHFPAICNLLLFIGQKPFNLLLNWQYPQKCWAKNLVTVAQVRWVAGALLSICYLCLRVVLPTQEWLNLLQSHTLSLLKLNFPKQRTSLGTGSQWSTVIGTKWEISLSAKVRHLVGSCDIPFSAAWNGCGLDCECEPGCFSHGKEVLAMTSSAYCCQGSKPGQMVSKETLHHTASANLLERTAA